MELSSKIFSELLDYVRASHGRVVSADRPTASSSEIPAAALVMGECHWSNVLWSLCILHDNIGGCSPSVCWRC